MSIEMNGADDGDQLRRVLSIQSHVVSGYVGNKSATFPLQVLGFEIDAINSVQFSNHTGYGFWKGSGCDSSRCQILNSSELGDLMEGLRSNDLIRYSHLLTGYIASPSFADQVVEVVQELKRVNPSLIYVCDPVMGDRGRMYVPQELMPIFRDRIVPLADVIVPNQFEAELLTGVQISCERDALTAIDALHRMGVATVVLSSTELNGGDDDGDDVMLCFASSISPTDGRRSLVRLPIPRLQANFTGTGDLFAALFLAWMDLTESNIKLSLERTTATLQSILRRTLEYAQDHGLETCQPRLTNGTSTEDTNSWDNNAANNDNKKRNGTVENGGVSVIGEEQQTECGTSLRNDGVEAPPDACPTAGRSDSAADAAAAPISSPSAAVGPAIAAADDGVLEPACVAVTAAKADANPFGNSAAATPGTSAAAPSVAVTPQQQRSRLMELRLVQSKADIERPHVTIEAEETDYGDWVAADGKGVKWKKSNAAPSIMINGV